MSVPLGNESKGCEVGNPDSSLCRLLVPKSCFATSSLFFTEELLLSFTGAVPHGSRSTLSAKFGSGRALARTQAAAKRTIRSFIQWPDIRHRALSAYTLLA